MGVLFAVVEYGCVSVLERTKLIHKHIEGHRVTTALNGTNGAPFPEAGLGSSDSAARALKSVAQEGRMRIGSRWGGRWAGPSFLGRWKGPGFEDFETGRRGFGTRALEA